MRWIRSQVISSLMFQMVPLPVLAAGAAMQPRSTAPVTPPAQHRVLGAVCGVSQVTHKIVDLSLSQSGAVIARH
jgi:hypothetical protein